MSVYNRCVARGALPEAGGVLDQQAWLLEAFDAIDATRAAWKRNEADNAEADRIREKLLQKYDGR